jgi:plasmid maintenance system antidote protein VapI
MDLMKYLHKHHLTITQFSEIIGYTRTHVSAVVNGNRNVGKKLAKEIEEATQGQVKMQSLKNLKKKIEQI